MKKALMPLHDYANMINATVEDGINNKHDIETIIKKANRCSAYSMLKHQYRNFESFNTDLRFSYSKQIKA
jgi:hypothetical protein